MRPRARQAARQCEHHGGTLGGPSPTSCSFSDPEGHKRWSLTTFFTVPDAALRAGDFSNARNTNGSLQNIYNPFTGRTASGDSVHRQQDSVGLINQTALKVMQLFDAERRNRGGGPDEQLPAR